MRRWESLLYQGDFLALPAPFTWSKSAVVGHMLDASRVMDLGELGTFANEQLAHAEAAGHWVGTARDLWLCLFFEHRRWRHFGIAPAGKDLLVLDDLCEAFRRKLIALSVSEKAELKEIMKLENQSKSGDGVVTEELSDNSHVKNKNVKSRFSAQIKEVLHRNKLVNVALEEGFNAFLPVYDDGIDLILCRENTDKNDEVYRVQLKARWTIDKKYIGRGLYIAFPYDGVWYLAPHDELVDLAIKDGIEATESWSGPSGLYSRGRLSANILAQCAKYKFPAVETNPES